MTVIPNIKMPQNLYRDLRSVATWKHTTINNEIRTRLETTLDPRYAYNSTSPYADRIRLGAERQYLLAPQKIVSSFRTSKVTYDVFKKIKFETRYEDDVLVKEIVARLAFTMNDPFYYEFIDREDNLVLSLFLFSLRIHAHRECCVSFRVHSLTHKPDSQSHY